MRLELARFNNELAVLVNILDSAFSMKDDLTERIERPVLEDGTDLWKTDLDSKTTILYGEKNEEGRNVFKIDNEFNLDLVTGKKIDDEGLVSIDRSAYLGSSGTEFVIIKKGELNEAKVDYAIRADKYQSIKERLARGECKLCDLVNAGGFKVNAWLRPSEIYADEEGAKALHDGWLELFVGKNNASAEEYKSAARLMKDYVLKAKEHACFQLGRGMGFWVDTGQEGCAVRWLYVRKSDYMSHASNGSLFGDKRHFLRVHQDGDAEGNGAQETQSR